MTPEQWQQVRDVLQDVVELPANQRSAYLDAHCAGEPALRQEVEQLLAAEGNVATSFLESPAVEQLPPQPDTSLSGTVLAAGTKLGPYVVQSLIGAGGMGEVYKARDTRLNRTVVVKVLPHSLSADPCLAEASKSLGSVQFGPFSREPVSRHAVTRDLNRYQVVSYAWACGPPIDMKIGWSLCCTLMERGRRRSVYTLDEVGPFVSLIGKAVTFKCCSGVCCPVGL